MSDLKKFDISGEQWREYDVVGREWPYRIDKPRTLYIRPGGTTHRIVDAEGVAHCVPFGGTSGTVVRWYSKPGEERVRF